MTDPIAEFMRENRLFARTRKREWQTDRV